MALKTREKCAGFFVPMNEVERALNEIRRALNVDIFVGTDLSRLDIGDIKAWVETNEERIKENGTDEEKITLFQASLYLKQVKRLGEEGVARTGMTVIGESGVLQKNEFIDIQIGQDLSVLEVGDIKTWVSRNQNRILEEGTETEESILVQVMLYLAKVKLLEKKSTVKIERTVVGRDKLGKRM